MLTLIADRFVCRVGTEGPPVAHGFSLAIDLATGNRVRLQIESAGTRSEQNAWVESCTRIFASGALVDFGFVGTDFRFQAISHPGITDIVDSPSWTPTVLDWLESQRLSCSGILRVEKLPNARELRLNGFIPCNLSIFDDPSLSDLVILLEGQSVVLLDRYGSPSGLALAMLKARRVNARETCALSVKVRLKADPTIDPSIGGGRLQPDCITHAAEKRPAYGPRPALHLRSGGSIADAERLRNVGRHAAAERMLRAASAAFDRRGDVYHRGEAEVSLGQLLLARGRATEAVRMFEQAHDRFQQVRAPAPAVSAMSHLGVAQTDLGLLSEGERSCRAARSAAIALSIPELAVSTGVALARTLLWLEQHSEAQSLLETLTPGGNAEASARYWCLVARLHIVRNHISDAWRALERARPAGAACSPVIESLVRRWEAAIQARIGDVESLERHVYAGLAAARAARLPLRSLKLRLTLVEGLVHAGRMGRARAAAAHLRGMAGRSLPPLLRQRVQRTVAILDRMPSNVDGRPDRAHETAPDFGPDGAGEDVEGLRDLLSVSHQFEDEAEALNRAAAAVRKHTRALSVGLFGCARGDLRLFGAAGAANPGLARRSFDAGITIGPEPSAAGVEGAVPIRYLGRFIGALSIRWAIEGPQHPQRAMVFCAAAAAACAPLVYVVLERQCGAVQSDSSPDLLGVSPAIDDVRKAVSRAANAPFTVLIEGESGSGKELVARAIHRIGCRRERRFCAFNCAAMPEDLVDAELFGHAKGAFTGAVAERLGLFESADGGTVFLDEVGELSSRAQAKVLRALQEGEVRRVGENFTRSFDARLVAATNRSLRVEVEAGRFRQDLLYRLDVIRIIVPPLRERVEDIPLLAVRFWRQSADRIGSKAVLGQSVLSALARYDWPGNVRELQNVLTALVVASPSRGVVGSSELPAAIARATQTLSQESLESARLKFEERFVRAALARSAGHRGRTAASLGLSRQGLAKLMQRLHLDA